MAGIALFRADASSSIGSGHVRRCIAIAQALRGWRCHFAVSEESLTTVPELAHGAFDVRVLTPAAHFDPSALSACLPDGCDLLVVDHYGIDCKYETSVPIHQVLAIDDLANRPHDCDVLVDATPGRISGAYQGLVPSDATLLLGGAYAPLRTAFAIARERRRGRRIGRRLFVNFGGTDPDDVTGQVLDTLAAMTRPDGLEVDVVIGHGTRHGAAIADRVAEMDFVRLHVAPPEPAAIMLGCDVAIGAGGVSALERCALGLPSVLMVIAENQRLVTEGVVRGGGGVFASTAADAVHMALDLVNEPGTLDRTGRSAMVLCDGRGAARIALWIDPSTANDGRSVRLRPAVAEDESRVLAWQRQPGTRRYAREPRVPTENEHHAWFVARLADPDCLLNILLHGSEAAGVIRLDRREEGYEISVNVDSSCQGQGIGRAGLSLARRLIPEVSILAHVKGDNTASRALFRRAGYKVEGAWLVDRPQAP
jgi:UDP-2,4-diacetamido-2,4,6-trideoxy-beta-L-altropyranose hydrolase